jgi:hypothetical protein
MTAFRIFSRIADALQGKLYVHSILEHEQFLIEEDPN